MANTYNSNPILINTTYTGGWRGKQTLNTGTTPGYTFPAQFGIRVFKVIWMSPGASASFSVTDPNDSTILLEDATPASFAGSSPEYDFENAAASWRDFNVTISAGTLLIYYRA